MLSKEDYIRLPKERLAELLVEQNQELINLRNLLLRSTTTPNEIQQIRPFCYSWGGVCTNPQMDCVNCPRFVGQSWIIKTSKVGSED